MKNFVFASAGGALMLAATHGHAALPDGISGHWFNPDQSGHGITLTMVDPSFVVMVWHVFDSQGNPMTLYMEGDVSGRRIDGTAYAPTGMRFGQFDSAELELPVWGEFTFEFDSCTNAELSWYAEDPIFGSGSIPFERLAFTHGLECSLPPPNELPTGLYIGRTESDGGIDQDFEAVVDLEGRLWGMDRGPNAIPSPMWVGARLPWVVVARPVGDTSTIHFEGHASKMLWTFWPPERSAHDAIGEWFGPATGGELHWLDDNSNDWTLTWLAATDEGKTLLAPLTLEGLTGRYEVPMSDQNPGGSRAWLEIDVNGGLCIEMPASFGEPDKECHFTGQLSLPDANAGLIDFNLAPYRGRGYVTDGPDGIELVLIGDNSIDGRGFGLVAIPED